MPRGIPWDDLTLFREKKPVQEKVTDLADSVPEQRDFQKDSYNIGKRALFGLVVRSLAETLSASPLSQYDFN